MFEFSALSLFLSYDDVTGLLVALEREPVIGAGAAGLLRNTLVERYQALEVPFFIRCHMLGGWLATSEILVPSGVSAALASEDVSAMSEASAIQRAIFTLSLPQNDNR